MHPGDWLDADSDELLRIEEDYDAMFGFGAFRTALQRWRQGIEDEQAEAVHTAEQILRGNTPSVE
jgi:hypothetical protein